jgi:hypothetical protein
MSIWGVIARLHPRRPGYCDTGYSRHRPGTQAVRTGVFMVTSSSDIVGCTATVRSKSFGRAHLHRDPGQLDHLAGLRGDDVTAQDLLGGLGHDKLHQHPVGASREGRLHGPEGGAVDVHRFLFARLFLAQADGAEFRLGEDGRRDQVVIDGGGLPLNTVSTKAMPSRIATGVRFTRLVTSPMA